MDAEKDYYAILGVLPSIDDVALGAVYRALLKKYHPDVFSGEKTEAEKRTKEIIEAYKILSDPESRKKYDNEKKSNGFGSYQQEEQTTTSAEVAIADWETIKKYQPETEEMRVNLAKLSPSLAFTFQITVLEKKLGANANDFAKTLENEFFQRYFGTNQKIHAFVLHALIDGRRDVAKEVNRAIKILGTPENDYAARRFLDQVRDTMKYDAFPENVSSDELPAGCLAITFYFMLLSVAAVTVLVFMTSR